MRPSWPSRRSESFCCHRLVATGRDRTIATGAGAEKCSSSARWRCPPSPCCRGIARPSGPGFRSLPKREAHRAANHDRIQQLLIPAREDAVRFELVAAVHAEYSTPFAVACASRVRGGGDAYGCTQDHRPPAVSHAFSWVHCVSVFAVASIANLLPET